MSGLVNYQRAPILDVVLGFANERSRHVSYTSQSCPIINLTGCWIECWVIVSCISEHDGVTRVNTYGMVMHSRQ